MGRYYSHYYEKFTEVIKLKCGYDFELQLQVSNICHVNNIFRTRLSPMYCVNLAETSQTHRSTINACLKI